MAFFYPFFPVWLTARALSETDIAWVMSAPLVFRFMVTPAIGRIADGMSDRRWLMAGLTALTLAGAIGLTQQSRFWPILLISTVMLLMYQAIGPLCDATVVSMVRRGIARDYGRLRLWGSVSFGIFAVVAGLLMGWSGPDMVLIGYIGGLVALLFCTAVLPSGAPRMPQIRRERFNLVKRPVLAAVFAAASLIFASQAMLVSFGSVRMLALGFPDWAVGMLWTVAVIAEIVMFWLGPPALQHLGPWWLLVIAALVSFGRWCGMAFDPSIAATGLLQLLHAATFSCTYLGLMALVQRLVEDEAGARAQSAFVTMSGLTMAAATLATGPLYQTLGRGAYFAVAVLPVLALVILLMLQPKLDRAEAAPPS